MERLRWDAISIESDDKRVVIGISYENMGQLL